MAQLLELCPANISAAAQRLRDGRLVAFPTETVYGLGAHALDEKAVLSIFEAKGRPLTDPVIVHVLNTEDAQPLVVTDSSTQPLFLALAKHFWPGPLTMILPAAPQIPKVVLAGGDSVGVRCPANTVARDLLAAAKIPVAAPSANRFAHVSPTAASHVMEDLRDKDVAILDGGGCAVGIESTIVLVKADQLLVLRRGGISDLQLKNALLAEGHSEVPVQTQQRNHTSAAQAQVAPGQLLTHYAPDVRSVVMLTPFSLADVPPGDSSAEARKAVLIDFGAQVAAAAPLALAYRDLSPSGSILEAEAQLFATLRWAETVAGAELILLPWIPSWLESLSPSATTTPRDEEQAAQALAVADRVFRSVSGQAVAVCVVHGALHTAAAESPVL